MGQYHMAVNLDKREFLYSHEVGDGLKLMEQAMSGPGGIGSALILLLAVSNGETGRGGGDFHVAGFGDVIGRWGGDRIAIVGDYAEDEDLDLRPSDPPASAIYGLCSTSEDPKAEMAEMVKHYKKLAAEAAEQARTWDYEAKYAEAKAKGGIVPQVYDSPDAWKAETLNRAAHYEQLAEFYEDAEPFTNITPRVREALKAEGWITYGGDGWMRRTILDTPLPLEERPKVETEPLPTK